MIGYDKRSENDSMLLDLPFYEGGGTITRDQAKAHHQDITLVNTPSWERLESEFDFGFGTGFESGVPLVVLEFNGTTEYGYLDNADSIDLDFIANDYSYGVWLNWESGDASQILIGRYELNVSGWEIYLTFYGATYYLTLRHSHAGTLIGVNARSSCYSVGWTYGTWFFAGISRIGGGEAQHYRNGIALTMATGGLVDPETNNDDMVIGIRYTKDSNFYKGKMWRPRLWKRSLSASEWLNIFEKERRYFGV